MVKKIGILTGGGDCPGLNAVISAIVRSSHRHGIEVVGFKKGFEGLLMGDEGYVKLGLAEVRGIVHLGGTILGTTNKGNFKSKVGAGNKMRIDPDILERSKEQIARLGIECLVVIGGDGSLSTALQFQEEGTPIVGIPKSIDNDLGATEKTFGFSTGVDIISESLGRIHTTAVSHDRVFLVETMGRSAGWLTLYGGIAGGADMILLPEIKFNYDSIMTFLRERKKNNRHYAVIVVAEAAAAEGESPIYKKQRADEENLFGGGLVPHIADVIETLGQDEFEVRTVVLGHLQRGGSPNAEDRILSERFGEGAVRAILDEKFGQMVALQADKIVTVPIEEAVKEVRHVDPNGELVTMAKNVGISFGE